MDDSLEQAVSSRFKKIQLVSIISFVLILVILVVAREGNLSIESIAAEAEGNSLRSVLVLLVLFGIKSLSIIIPLVSLYVASGMLFSPVKAVLVSYLGLAVTLSLPYILGRWSGTEEMQYIKKKYPKIKQILELQDHNAFLASFLIRLIGWLPCDVLSFYFGACGMNYQAYLISALLGCTIGLVTNTLLGDVIMNPLSKEFALLILVKILVSAGAVGITYYVNKGKKGRPL